MGGGLLQPNGRSQHRSWWAAGPTLLLLSFTAAAGKLCLRPLQALSRGHEFHGVYLFGVERALTDRDNLILEMTRLRRGITAVVRLDLPGGHLSRDTVFEVKERKLKGPEEAAKHLVDLARRDNFKQILNFTPGGLLTPELAATGMPVFSFESSLGLFQHADERSLIHTIVVNPSVLALMAQSREWSFRDHPIEFNASHIYISPRDTHLENRGLLSSSLGEFMTLAGPQDEVLTLQEGLDRTFGASRFQLYEGMALLFPDSEDPRARQRIIEYGYYQIAEPRAHPRPLRAKERYKRR